MGWRFRTRNSASMSRGCGVGVKHHSALRQPPPRIEQGERGLPAPPPTDPFNNLREQREKKETIGIRIRSILN